MKEKPAGGYEYTTVYLCIEITFCYLVYNARFYSEPTKQNLMWFQLIWDIIYQKYTRCNCFLISIWAL